MTTELALLKSIGVEGTVSRVSILGHSVNYMVCGSGQPLLLIHGGTFGWGAWFANIAELSKRFTVYAIDLPGGGNSSSVDYRTIRPHEFVDVVSVFIRKNNLVKPRIVGHSFGGWVAMHVARQVELDRLILIDIVGLSAHKTFADRVLSAYPFAKFLAKTVLRPKRENTVLEKFLRGAFYKKTDLSGEFLDYFYEVMAVNHNLLFVSRLIALQDELYSPEALTSLQCPVLIVWGDHDPISPLAASEAAWKDVRGVQLEVFPDTGHVPQIESPTRFNELALKFLRPSDL